MWKGVPFCRLVAATQDGTKAQAPVAGPRTAMARRIAKAHAAGTVTATAVAIPTAGPHQPRPAPAAAVSSNDRYPDSAADVPMPEQSDAGSMPAYLHVDPDYVSHEDSDFCPSSTDEDNDEDEDEEDEDAGAAQMEEDVVADAGAAGQTDGLDQMDSEDDLHDADPDVRVGSKRNAEQAVDAQSVDPAAASDAEQQPVE